MIRKFLLLSIIVPTLLQSQIVEITQIEEVRPYIQEKCLCLFDVDDTLITNPFSLGRPAWRNWSKEIISQTKAEFEIYDALTLYIAKNAPYIPVESSTAEMIAKFQLQKITVFAFTARGRSQWYTTDIEGVDQFTHQQLNQVGIDFTKTHVPDELQSLESTYFYNGIIFARHIQKGDLLKHLFKDLHYSPSLIIFVDDKLEQVKSCEAALKELNIPFIGFWYRHVEMEQGSFNPQLTNVQLSNLLQGLVVHDDEAQKIIQSHPSEQDPKITLKQTIENLDLDQIVPELLLTIK